MEWVTVSLRGRVLAFEQFEELGRQLEQLVPCSVGRVGEGDAVGLG
jgi:hypothetical protein